ncbi:carboxypeptidase-like regulatory domain-containing protein [Winogradskyella sp. PE311]|uniref:carboxypeptidase-like regulatory domain-containing protein n=1 Tax=Winogradskyella sp. PE311 TaxID=3366943 RepID=UPI003980DAB1
MISKLHLVSLFFLVISLNYAQTLSGKVIDANTKQPLEVVTVYFDNTTIGTTTNEEGKFSIEYSAAIQSTLVISYLGYEKVFISDYRNINNITIELKESINALDEVVIDADDGMSRAEKLRWFRKEFLGKSENGKSCKIRNEKDIRIRYNKQKRTLIAWSKAPIIVKNRSLQYEISFDIIDFEIVIGKWNATSVIYSGTTFFKDLDESKKKRVLKKREDTYNGSVQHFIRALYNKNLEEEGYIFGKKGLKVNPYEFFNIYDTDKFGYKTVTLKEKLDIFYKDVIESLIQTTGIEFKIDKYGNFSPVTDVLFGGNMGSQRIGDTLPSDYGLNE